VSSISALPAIVEAVGDRAEVYVDGGVRRGSDVLKALALGARAAFAARPFVYGLAAGGQPGVSRALAILNEELALSLSLSGCESVSSVARDLVAGAERVGPHP
jgi:isopentenyl diphosphate isomerase/L-lactate dehydrogenase-like FMN-dependent dehydrogenase